jgi:hypothetical protein
VSCGVVGGNLIGPRVTEGSETAPYYRNIVEHWLTIYLDHLFQHEVECGYKTRGHLHFSAER